MLKDEEKKKYGPEHSHTVTQPFLTPKIAHPSPAALCAILPTLRENKGSLGSLCCTSGEHRNT